MIFERGRRYKATIRLSGVTARLASAGAVQKTLHRRYGLVASVRGLGGDCYEAIGTWERDTQEVYLPESIEVQEEIQEAGAA